MGSNFAAMDPQARVTRVAILFQLTLIFTILTSLVTAQNENVEVKTTEGTVVGLKSNSGNFTVFYGIPYAGDVSGNNRFKAAPEPASYKGKFNASDSSIKCVQNAQNGVIGEENCLTLDIFTKDIKIPKPVFVWINGEEYSKTNNTPRFTYKTLVESDIVLIDVNYRLSVFGFLCLGIPEAPGNAGLKDVVQALQWIQKNIAAFGGDAKNVILIGHGSGAAMVDLITLSPLSKDLVHKSITLSGSALAPWAIAYNPISNAKTFSAKFGQTENDYEKLVQYLRKIDKNLLAFAASQFSFENNSLLFAPCIENAKLPGAFLVHAPLKLLRSGKYLNIPYIASYVDKEGTMRIPEATNRKWLEMMKTRFEDFLPVDLELKPEATRKAVAQNVSSFYFNNGVITIEDFLEYEGDTLTTIPVIKGVKERAATSTAPVRLLRFSFKESNSPDWPFSDVPLNGMPHGGILKFLFDVDSSPVDEKPKKALINRFVAFAKTGNPVSDILPGDTLWQAATSKDLFYLKITGNQRTSEQTGNLVEDSGTNPHYQNVKFWDDLYEKFYREQEVSSASRLLKFSCIIILSQILLRLI